MNQLANNTILLVILAAVLQNTYAVSNLNVCVKDHA